MLLILSCDDYSDLWDGHIKLLEQNWPDRSIRACIVTNKPTSKKYNGIDIIVSPHDMEWSDRLAYALKHIQTDYVMITLDDYFLIKPVSNARISLLLEMMQEENLSYIRLFPRPKRATREEFTGYTRIYRIDTNENYSVNLYPGIWSKDFLQYAAISSQPPWQFEVSLPRRAREYGAQCVVSYNSDFVILDVVRKGKVLHKAARYFKRHDVYHGNRPIQSYAYEIRLGIRTFGARHMPRPIVNAARNFMIRRGHHYYSQDS